MVSSAVLHISLMFPSPCVRGVPEIKRSPNYMIKNVFSDIRISHLPTLLEFCKEDLRPSPICGRNCFAKSDAACPWRSWSPLSEESGRIEPLVICFSNFLQGRRRKPACSIIFVERRIGYQECTGAVVLSGLCHWDDSRDGGRKCGFQQFPSGGRR
jgi:hypothetical protein